jgi:hypothetical protein
MRHSWLLLAACLPWAGAEPDLHARRKAEMEKAVRRM